MRCAVLQQIAAVRRSGVVRARLAGPVMGSFAASCGADGWADKRSLMGTFLNEIRSLSRWHRTGLGQPPCVTPKLLFLCLQL